MLRAAHASVRRLSSAAAFPSVEVLGAGPVEVRNVWCIGRNYEAHARELGNAVPTEEPVLFLKASSAVRPLSAGPLAFADESFHHEIEMVLLVGEHVPLGGLAEREPTECVSAVGLGLDLTRRGKQSSLKQQGKPWTLAKSFGGAALVSPFAPCDGSFALGDVSFELAVNEAVRQHGHVSQMIFDAAFQLRFISSFAPLMPGDLIFTGTPEGVGPIQQGDRSMANCPSWESRVPPARPRPRRLSPSGSSTRPQGPKSPPSAPPLTIRRPHPLALPQWTAAPAV